MEQIPTVKEFFLNKAKELNSDPNDMPEWMINESKELVKLHVEAALKAASENALTTLFSPWYSEVDKGTILCAYPLDNIK